MDADWERVKALVHDLRACVEQAPDRHGVVVNRTTLRELLDYVHRAPATVHPAKNGR